MNEATINYQEIETNEEIKGTSEFTFWRIIQGLFCDGKNLSEEINAAIADAYAEN